MAASTLSLTTGVWGNKDQLKKKNISVLCPESRLKDTDLFQSEMCTKLLTENV